MWKKWTEKFITAATALTLLGGATIGTTPVALAEADAHEDAATEVVAEAPRGSTSSHGRDRLNDETHTGNFWNHNLMNIGSAHADGYTGVGINVAVLDTGFYAGHPDLTLAGGESLFESDDWTNDHTGHGTHVAGIIAAHAGSAYPGVAPDANVYGIKIYHEDDVNEAGQPLTDVSNIAAGIDRAVVAGAHIIVISSGVTYDSPELAAAVSRAAGAGTLMIAAAGNGGGLVNYPAAYADVIAVSSVDVNLGPAGDIIYGAENELAAPGVQITGLAAPSTGADGYITMSGSSQAAPHVAGLAAIYMQKYGADAEHVRALLHESAYDLGSENLFGYGLAGYELTEGVPTETEDEPEEQTEENKKESTEVNDSEVEDVAGEDTDYSRIQAARDQVQPAAEKSGNYDRDKKDEQKAYEVLTVVPTIDGDTTTIDADTVHYVISGGMMIIDLKEGPDDLTLQLTAEQATELQHENIHVTVRTAHFQWTIPGSNFTDRATDLVYRHLPDAPSAADAASSVIQFQIFVDGEEVREFPHAMTYSLPTDNPEGVGVYRLNLESSTWDGLSGDMTDDGLTVYRDRTLTLALFADGILPEPGGTYSSENADETDRTDIASAKNHTLRKWLLGTVGLTGLAGGGYFYYRQSRRTTGTHSTE